MFKKREFIFALFTNTVMKKSDSERSPLLRLSLHWPRFNLVFGLVVSTHCTTTLQMSFLSLPPPRCGSARNGNLQHACIDNRRYSSLCLNDEIMPVIARGCVAEDASSSHSLVLNRQDCHHVHLNVSGCVSSPPTTRTCECP